MSEEPQRLVRVPEGRIVAGVCTGLGRQTGIDPTVFRVGFGLLTCVNGWGVLLYAAAFVLMSDDPARLAPGERVMHRRLSADGVLALLGLILAFGVVLSFPTGNLSVTLTALLVLAFVVLVATGSGVNLIQVARTLPERLRNHPHEDFPAPAEPARRIQLTPAGYPAGYPEYPDLPAGAVDLARLAPDDRVPDGRGPDGRVPDDLAPGGYRDTPPAKPRKAPPGSKVTAATVPLAMLAAGVTVPFVVHDHLEEAVGAPLAAALCVVGLGLVVSAWVGRSRGLAALGALLSVCLLITAIPAQTGLAGGRYGEVDWRPVNTVDHTYKIIAGEGKLDLSSMPLRPGERVRVRAELGAGQLTITLPQKALVELDVSTLLGDLVVETRTVGGPRARVAETLMPEVLTSNPPVIELRVRGRIGEVEVSRA